MVQGEDISLNTLMAQNNPNFSIARTAFNTLTEYDKSLTPKPSLATSWSSTDGGATLQVNLRQGVTYHSGRPFGPDDVIFCLDYIKKSTTSSQCKYIAKDVVDASKTGPDQVTIRFAHAYNSVFDLFQLMVMLDKESIADLTNGTSIIGTGPFKVTKYTPGSGFSMTRNADYWITGRPYLDAVDVSVLAQSTSMLSSLQSGESQLALDLAPLDAAGIRADPQFQLVISQANDECFYVASNVTVKPLDNPTVRQAIAWAIDRNRILKQVLGGIGETSSLPWAPSSPAYDTTKKNTYTYNPSKAKQLLDGAGAAGSPVKIYYNAGLATNTDIATIIQSDLNAIGLKCSLVPLQAATFTGQLISSGFDGLFVNVHGFGQMHPATLINGAFPFNASKNSSNFVNSNYQAIAQKLATATDASASKPLYSQLNDLLIQEQFVTDLVASSHTFAISQKLKGLSYTLVDAINLDSAYLTV